METLKTKPLTLEERGEINRMREEALGERDGLIKSEHNWIFSRIVLYSCTFAPFLYYIKSHRLENRLIDMTLQQKNHHKKELVLRLFIGFIVGRFAKHKLFGVTNDYDFSSKKIEDKDFESEAEMRYSQEFRDLLVHKKRKNMPTKIREFDDPLLWGRP